MMNSENNSPVGLALINWNSGPLTLACLRSVLAGDLTPQRIVVVDNGSEDGSPDEIQNEFPDIHIIRESRNTGFSVATNTGVRYLLDQTDADYIWVLNNDVTVAPSCLSAMVSRFDLSPTAAVVTARILYAKPNDLIWYAGASCESPGHVPEHVGQLETDTGQYSTATTVCFVSGCCMLVRRDTFKLVGGFDESFFIYCEDADWCARAMAQGVEMWYEPDAMMWHHVSAGMRKNHAGHKGNVSPRFIYLSQRNKLWYLRRHASGASSRFRAILRGLPSASYMFIGFLLKGRWKKLSALTRAYGEGLLRNVDEAPENVFASSTSRN